MKASTGMKVLRYVACGWLAIVASAILFWMLTGIWLLHSPHEEGERLLTGVAVYGTSAVAAMYVFLEKPSGSGMDQQGEVK